MPDRSRSFFLATPCLVWLLTLVAQPALSQGFPGGGFPTGGFGGGFGGSGGFGGFGSGGGGGFSGAQPDSQQGPAIPPDTRVLEREQEKERQALLTWKENFDAFPYWDPAERWTGFLQHSGQIGKPTQRFRYGLPERYDLGSAAWDPVMGRYDPYMSPESGVLHFDTRTPFVNVRYAQGSKDLQIARVLISQNITPRWNAALSFERRKSIGAYRSFTTDHTLGWASGSYRSQGGRYRLYFHAAFDRLRDEIHGGVPRRQDPVYLVEDGLIQDVAGLYNNAFFKSFQSPNLSDAQSQRYMTGFYADQQYRLRPAADSLDRGIRLTLRAETSWRLHRMRFSDTGIRFSSFSENLVPVYPAFSPDSTEIAEGYVAPLSTLRLSVRAESDGSRWLRATATGGLSLRQLSLRKDSLTLVGQAYVSPWLNAQATLGRLRAELLYQPSFSTRLAPEQDVKAQIRLPLLALPDSAPALAAEPRLSIEAGLLIRSMNPSLFQRFYLGDSGYAFVRNPDLQNQRIQRLQGGIRWNVPARVLREDTLLPGYLRAEVFATQASQLIIYDQQLRPVQAGRNLPLDWAGIQIAARLRLFGKYYFTTETTLQRASQPSDSLFGLYMRSQPAISGRSGILYESGRVSFAERIRVGIEAVYFTSYAGQAADPVSGEFFQTSYEVIPYVRADAYVTMQVHGVLLFARLQHINEGLLLAGYYTTPFYPMLERTFSFGVSWSFFD